MKTKFFLLFAPLLACSMPTERTGQHEAHLGRPAVAPHLATLSRAAKEAAMLDASKARAAPVLGGFVQIFDDQLTNTHGITNMIFVDQHLAAGCYETYPIEGGECWKAIACDPPEPDFTGQLVDVGAVSLSSTFDTFERAPAIFQEPETRSGPFWRGDGDSVRFAFAGTEGVAPPFEHEARAPVGDAVGIVPSTVPRTAPLRLSWRYANGDQPAVGHLMVTVGQSEPAPRFLGCRVPMARRAMEIPASLLERFSPGAGMVLMSSTASETIDSQVTSGPIRLLLSITSTVDIGNPDSDENVVFE
jgi:hypothetical protein